MAETKDNPKPEPTWTLPVEGTLYALAVDSATACAYVGGSAGTVFECDLNAPTLVLRPRFHDDAYVAALAVLRDGPHAGSLAVARYDGTLSVFDLRTGRRRVALEAHDGWVRDLCPLGEGTRVATAGDDMRVNVWDAATGRLVHGFSGHALQTPQGYVSAIYSVDASPDGRYVAAADRIGDVRVWDLAAGRPCAQLRAPEFYTFDGAKRDRSIGGIRRVRFSPDGRSLALAGIGQVTNVDGFVGRCRLEVWNWREAQRTAVLQDAHHAVLNDVLWSDDGRRLTAAGGGDGGGILLDWTIGDEQPSVKAKFRGHTHRLARVGGGRLLWAAGFEGLHAWDFPAWAASAESETSRGAG